MHPFFTEIKSHPELCSSINSNILCLPNPYFGKEKIKAIMLGADPTNHGNKIFQGLKVLDTVFGIGSDFENDFFNLQQINLKEIGLIKENLFIQNLCRNYFNQETAKNKLWHEVARLWIPYLKKEINELYPGLPVLVTAEKIMEALVPEAPKAAYLYSMRVKTPLYSEQLNRYIFPLYRHPSYFLAQEKWTGYRRHLKKKFDE